jgi:hypothetical protein
VKSQKELNALFAQAREERRALVAELSLLDVEKRRRRLERESLLVRALVYIWEDPASPGMYGGVGRNKLERTALKKEFIRVHNAAGRAAMRHRGHNGVAPVPWHEAASDFLDELKDIPLTVSTFEFERALRDYR